MGWVCQTTPPPPGGGVGRGRYPGWFFFGPNAKKKLVFFWSPKTDPQNDPTPPPPVLRTIPGGVTNERAWRGGGAEGLAVPNPPLAGDGEGRHRNTRRQANDRGLRCVCERAPVLVCSFFPCVSHAKPYEGGNREAKAVRWLPTGRGHISF